MKPASFHYERPSTTEEALALLTDRGDEAKILAGGQSLVPLLNLRLAFPGTLIDINGVAGLDYLEEDSSVTRVGALVRQQRFGTSETIRAKVPLAAAAVAHVGHHVTRNRGTVAGSLAHADSRGELPVALSALGGSVVAASQSGHREIHAADLFVTDFTSSLRPDEMIIESRWPALGPGWGLSFKELAIRHGDYALAMVAAGVHVRDDVVDEVRLVAGSVSDKPLVLDQVARDLTGTYIHDLALTEIRDRVMGLVDPVGDVHASADYRRHATAVLAERALGEAWQKAGDA
jgi:CO/xanthine dehydrogenase FAD-binding subunit